MDNLYTLQKIRQAFYKTFHRSGDWFFRYQNNETYEYGDDERDTKEAWEEFLENLEKVIVNE
jgi:hypothetical protein